MQKFLRILIIIFLFMMCLLIGAKLANVSLSAEDTVEVNSDTQNQNQNQIRLLVFVLDDLTQKNPRLNEVWSVIIYYQDAKGIMFIPLTNRNDVDFKDLNRNFVLTSEREPHQKTLKYFNTKYKTKWDANIVLDQFAVEYLFQWITQSSLDLNLLVGGSNSTLIENLCTSIGSQPLNSLETLDWQLIIPNHFKTNLPLDRMMDGWQKLSSGNPILCEMIAID
jgi:hypothetical protein